MRGADNSIAWPLVAALLTVLSATVPLTARSACIGFANTCVGEYSFGAITTGEQNTGIGFATLYSNTTGSYNIANGTYALFSNSIGNFNVANGTYALFANTTGNENTANGVNALRSNTVGSYNTATGTNALYGNTTGGFNTAIGYRALLGNSGGGKNTAIGSESLYTNTSGGRNVAIGSDSLYTNSAGNSNTAVGTYAMQYNATGTLNVGVGTYALRDNANGEQNTGIGVSALLNNVSGQRNVAIGIAAGVNVRGSDNIHIGGENLGLTSDEGVIRLGSPAFQHSAFVAGVRGVTTGQSNGVMVLIDSSGQLGTINSSRRFKEDIQPIGRVSEKLFGLRPVTFRYTQPFDDGSKPVQYGLIAEEVAEVMPELVVYGEDGKPETVSYHLLATLLLNEVQRDHRVMQAQADQLAELRRDNETQATRMAALEQQVAVLARTIGPVAKDRMVASAR
jgi:hypothetical protein